MSILINNESQPETNPAKEELSTDKTKSASADESQSEETSEASEASEDVQDQEDSEKESEDQEQMEDKDESKQKPKKGFKRRIDKLNQRLSEKDRELEYWKSQALKSEGKQETKPQAKTETKDSGRPKEPNVDDFETYGEYLKAQSKYIEDLTDFKFAEKEKATSVKSEQQKQLDAHNKRVEAAKKEISDYDDVLGEFIEEHGDVSFSAALEELILTSDVGPKVLYDLAKDPESIERLNKLGPMAAAKEFHKLELKYAHYPSKEVKKQTKAPPPISPVAKGTAIVKKDINDPNLPFKEYERMRREQMKRRA